MKRNYTKERIYEVYDRLMHEKKFENISVKQICDDADISRPTFYRLFEDKYDLMRSFYSNGIERIYAQGLEHEACAYAIHKYMLDHKALLLNLLKNDKECAFERYIFELTKDYYQALVLRNSGMRSLPPETLMDIEMYTAAANYAWKKWIINPVEESIDILQQRHMRLLPESIRPYIK